MKMDPLEFIMQTKKSHIWKKQQEVLLIGSYQLLGIAIKYEKKKKNKPN